jgi:dTDP-3,4-didehydro-2,6-dideoxy-alpha-D-glucose 3-reductase
MAPVRFGIIACSSIARRRFLPALAVSSLARLERIGSRDMAKAEQYAREFSAAKHGDYDGVLADPEVDAVYVSTPPLLHEEWVFKALANRKHVLCEKPAFATFSAAFEAVERSRANGVRLHEGYAFKHHPQHRVVRSLIETGRIGRPRFFQSEFTYPHPPEHDIRLDPRLGGGVFHDSAGYPVAAALLQMPGQPTAVFCRMGFDARTTVDDAFCLGLDFSGGEMAQMIVAFGVQYRSRYAVIGTHGRVEVERAFAVAPGLKTTVTLETDAGTESFSVDPADQFRLMIDDFSALLTGVSAVGEDFETELLRQHAVMDAAARSQREGRSVDLTEYRL